MDDYKKTELIIKAVATLLTLLAIVVGVFQFTWSQRSTKEREIEQRNFQAKFEILSKFKEIQNKQYLETASIISFLIIDKNYESDEYRGKLNRFWQLYWVELSAVETEEVEAAMVNFGKILTQIQEKNFKVHDTQIHELKIAGYKVANAIKDSARKWELPESLHI